MATATQIEEIRATLQRGLENLALSGNLKPLPLRQQVERPSLRTRPIPPVGAEDPIHTGGNQIKQPSNKVSGNNRSNLNGSLSDSDHYRPGSARGLSGIVSTPFAKTQNSSLNGAIRQSSLNTKPPTGTRARPGRPSSGTKRNPPAMSGRTYHSANSQSKLTDTKVSSSIGRGRPLPHPPSTMSPTRRKEVVSSLSGTGSEQSKKSGKTRKDSLSEDGEEWCDVDENEEEQFDPLMSERMPGDGASYDDFDEDDGLDGLDDDGMDDGLSCLYDESDTYSTYSMSSTKRGGSSKGGSLSAIDDLLKKTNGIDTSILGSKSKSERVLELLTTGTDDAQPPLSASLFSKVPPTINFVGDNQTVVSLPWELRKLLKWRMSPITPHVVKNCIARSGFRATKKANEWLGYWGKHMKASGFKSIREYQKVNHVPGSFQIGRKDRLWRNLHRMQLHYGKKDYNFFPQTYVLPFDLKLLKRAWEDGGQKQKWILKPPASARGIGIRVIHKWSQIPRRRAVIVQRYLAKPYLINGSKFDLRIYVYVSSYDPLRIYIFSNGLARFATMKYSSSMKSLSNKFMHLTNYSINKKNADFTPNSDSTACQGHKWSLKALWGFMQKDGVDTNAVWESIKDVVVKTIVCAESQVNSMIKANCKSRFSVHELFGFDIMLDENLRPWILEVNISPSLHSNAELDVQVKGEMIKDLLNISSFMIPDKNDVFTSVLPPNGMTKVDYSGVIMNKNLYTNHLAKDERAKHAFYTQKHIDEQCKMSILDTLTPDDIRHLVQTEDEFSRRGGFERAFPSPTSQKYHRFFEAPRYYNILLDEWVRKYHRTQARGLALLEDYCMEGIHLATNKDDSHTWTPISSVIGTREPRTSSAPSCSLPMPVHPSLQKSSSAQSLPKIRRRGSKMRSVSSSSSTHSLPGGRALPRPPHSHRIPDGGSSNSTTPPS
ncbi:tubulin polyglutamylase TTLL4-like isoform X1 [Lytechinus variegatus]|uniref:tubulin polyglutamylase TTLL4-like isoform X1 n=1 Tax=Lytechinus variegatus TaxID=7654 RepID=UPI001BB26E7E|nr:tubulin polyglutamylase TTLL4-like isoform X1 [Lytechinus variegatus]